MLFKLCTNNTMVYDELCFPARSLKFCCIPDRRSRTELPVRSSGARTLLRLGGQHLCLSQIRAGGIKHVLNDCTGRILLEACAQFPLDTVISLC